MISIDSSSSKTGWAYFEDAQYKKSGVIDFDTKECKKKYKGNSDKRIEDMCLAVISLLKEYKTKLYNIKTGFELGFNSDAKEAVGFVVLGYLRIMNKPSNVITVTGAKKEISLGSIVLPQEFK